MQRPPTAIAMADEKDHFNLYIRDGNFVDKFNRVVLLRGVNVAGSTKIPKTNRIPTQDWYEKKSISFVDRPFPLADAKQHFERLKRWGLTFIRFLVTWEAIEHEGPGIYDYEYLEYVRQILRIGQEYNMRIYIDPHQDVWSRWSGGDGAPLWTFELIGMEPRHFEATKAAITIQNYGGKPEDFPKMIWPSNMNKLASATMFTLFFGGEKYAPKVKVDGQSIQSYLQKHYINALAELAKHIKDLPNVIGFGTMNEPSPGYLNLPDLSDGFGPLQVLSGFIPTPFESMCLGDGIDQIVGEYSPGGIKQALKIPDRKTLVKPNCRAWKDGFCCVWRDEGVWEVNEEEVPVLLQPKYFADVDFGRDHYTPFALAYAKAIREHIPHAMVFAEMPPNMHDAKEFPPLTPSVLPNAVNATHWYDGITLFMGTWRSYFSLDIRNMMPIFGSYSVRQMFRSQLAEIKLLGLRNMKGAPTLIGECGIPFNMNDGSSFKSGDFRDQTAALNATMDALEENLLSYTLWCYTPDNNNKEGDLWNNEDLSIYSPDQAIDKTDPYDGARAPQAFIRPFARYIAGVPLQSKFNLAYCEYQLSFIAKDCMEMPTEIHVPKLHYPLQENLIITISSGKYEILEQTNHYTIKFFTPCTGQKQTLTLRSTHSRSPHCYLYGSLWVGAIAIVLFSLWSYY